MRINRQTLLKIAADTVEQRTRRERDILSIYLCGSLLGDDFLLGGTTDIDLVFIHADSVSNEREILRLSDEVHLDIAHYEQRRLRKPRQLRLNPRLGPEIVSCKILYDPQHFMDFTQASVGGQFDQPDYVIERSRQSSAYARQVWEAFEAGEHGKVGPAEVYRYLKAVEHAGNAVASLTGDPLNERRFLRHYRPRTEAVGHPGLYAGMLGLLGAPHVEVDNLQIWLVAWLTCLQALPSDKRPPRLDSTRIPYYQHAFEAMLDSEQPLHLLWPLLRTWTLAASLLPEDADGVTAWAKACNTLGLLGRGFGQRLQAMDAYLDSVEETQEEWARANGV